MSGQTPSAKVAKKSNRGSRPGEHRGGRKKGTPNKATAEIKELAQQYTAQALEALVRVMEDGESEAARVSAANAILDRGHGKPSQSIDAGGNIMGFLADVLAERRAKVAALNG